MERMLSTRSAYAPIRVFLFVLISTAFSEPRNASGTRFRSTRGSKENTKRRRVVAAAPFSSFGTTEVSLSSSTHLATIFSIALATIVRPFSVPPPCSATTPTPATNGAVGVFTGNSPSDFSRYGKKCSCTVNSGDARNEDAKTMCAVRAIAARGWFRYRNAKRRVVVNILSVRVACSVRECCEPTSKVPPVPKSNDPASPGAAYGNRRSKTCARASAIASQVSPFCATAGTNSSANAFRNPSPTGDTSLSAAAMRVSASAYRPWEALRCMAPPKLLETVSKSAPRANSKLDSASAATRSAPILNESESF
mmetsp:Transcript_14612/g.48371  ORF Transcript_14612/g.48371 Transcript_14612/m.48371 type:complete len:309 (-) Transcript_14612:1833-2759(-)